jgi:4,5-DOPA dioxygenase extradiol
MPVLFVGHGTPMNAIEDTEFSRAWDRIARALSRPKAILCVSAHWETDGTRVTATPKPKTIHDFTGFPSELNAKKYPAPGAPDLAKTVIKTITGTAVAADLDWGLDHGAWAVLCRMFPDADVPVLQLSLDRTLAPRGHYALGRELAPLRDQGVLIVGSGNMVHNLPLMEWTDSAFDWAIEADAKMKELILSRDSETLVRYESLGRAVKLAIPTNEHYLPMLYALALWGDNEPLSFFAEKVVLGSVSMRGFRVG